MRMNSIISGSLISLIVKALKILTTIAITRLIGPSAMGAYAATMNIVLFLSILALFGLPQQMIKKCQQEEIGTISFFRNYSLIFSTSIILMLSVFFLQKNEVIHIIKIDEYQHFFYSAILIFPLATAIETIGAVLIAKNQQVSKLFRVDFSVALLLLIYLLLLTYFNVSTYKLSIAYIVAILVTLIFLINHTKSKGYIQFKLSKISDIYGYLIEGFKEIHSRKYFVLIKINGRLFSLLPILFILDRFGAITLAYFAVANRLSSLPLILTNYFNSISMPQFAAPIGIENHFKVFKAFSRLGILVSTLPMIVFLLAGREILSLWGEDFTENAFTLLVVCCCLQILNGFTSATGAFLQMTDKERVVVRAGIIFVLIQILLLSVMPRELGITRFVIVGQLPFLAFNFWKLWIVQTR